MSTNLSYLFYNIPVIIGAIYCFSLEPDRLEISYVNEKFVNNVIATVKRSSRRGEYVGNVDFTLKHVWVNNITIDIIIYEYLSNAFKRSFVEFHFKYCTMIDKDMLVGAIVKKAGLKCPTLPCFSLEPDRLEISYVNEKFVNNVIATVKRSSRRGEYVGNVDFTLKHVWVNNITIDIIIYEYLSNAFKRSFVEFHFKYCTMIDKDMLVGAIVKKAGLKCPTLPGSYSFKNITLDVDIPYVPPFEAGKADITIKTTYGETVGYGYVVGHVQKKNAKEKKKLEILKV